MVRIIILILFSVQFCYSQISNSQFYFGRGLDSAAILTNDIADSSINLSKLIYVNGPKLIGNPAATYDSLKCIKLGTNLSFSNDTLNAASSGGTGDVNQNGNSFGATMVLGTNDNNTLELETNGVSRLGITSGATTGGEITATSTTTNTNTYNNGLTLRTISTGTPTTGFGNSILFQGESSTTNHRDMIRLASRWETATDGSRGSYLGIETVTGAGALLQRFKFTESGVLSIGSSSQALYSNSGITTAAGFTIGQSANALTLGGSSGTVTLSSSASAATAINITPTSTGGGVTINSTINNLAVPQLTIGTTTVSNNSTTMVNLKVSGGTSSSSGTAGVIGVSIANLINQSGSATGTSIGVDVNPTLTSLLGAYKGINIGYSNSNAYGIYQSGSTTKNIFVGKTCFGSTGSPTALVALAAGTTSANTAPLKFTSGSNLTTPEDGAVEYDGTNFFVSNSTATRYTVAKILSGHATLNFGNTAAGSSDDLTVTVTGAADGDEVILGVPNAAMNANASYFAWVSAADTLTIRHNNYSGSAIDPTSSNFKFSVIKR